MRHFTKVSEITINIVRIHILILVMNKFGIMMLVYGVP